MQIVIIQEACLHRICYSAFQRHSCRTHGNNNKCQLSTLRQLRVRITNLKAAHISDLGDKVRSIVKISIVLGQVQ